MDDFKVLILIPAFNEDKNIKNVIININNILKNTIHELLIVDDGSNDNTLKILKELNTNFKSNIANKGISHCYNMGIEYALNKNFSHIVICDADGQHDVNYIGKFISLLKAYDLVLGSRFNNNNIHNIPSCKILSNYCGARLVSFITNKKIRDITCGFRGFKLNKCYKNEKLQGFEFIFDMIFKALNNKTSFIYVEIPCIYYDDEFWCTRTIEIRALLNVAYNYANEEKKSLVRDILMKINDKEKTFKINFVDEEFYFYYIEEYQAYIIQTSINRAMNYMII